MRHVTYYYTFLAGLTGVDVHPDRKSAVRFYRREAMRYFPCVQLPRKTTTPTACGFACRRFGVMSIRLFRKNFPEWEGGKE